MWEDQMRSRPWELDWPWYDTAQVCPNGHVVTADLLQMPEEAHEHCERCGEKTMMACPECRDPLRGRRKGDFVGSYSVPPAFCHKCGRAHPWTERRIAAASELAAELESLQPEEIESLKRSIDEMLRDSPKAEVAAHRFKRLLAKAGGETARIVKEMVIEIVSETAKRAITAKVLGDS